MGPMANPGAFMLVQLWDAQSETYHTLAGMKTTRIALHQEIVNASTQASGPWRELLPESGMRALSVTGVGIATSHAAGLQLQSHAFANRALSCRLLYGQGQGLSGRFIIAHYERMGNYDDEEQLSLTLESAGAIRVV